MPYCSWWIRRGYVRPRCWAWVVWLGDAAAAKLTVEGRTPRPRKDGKMRKILSVLMLLVMGTGCSQQQLSNPNPEQVSDPTQVTVSPTLTTIQTPSEEIYTNHDELVSSEEDFGEEPLFEANCPIENEGYDYAYGLVKPYFMSFSPDGENMITVTAKNRLVLITLGVNDGEIGAVELPLPFPIYQATWSPAGGQIAVAAEATSGEEQQIYLLDVDNMSQMQAISQPYPVIHHLSWSGNGAYLAYSHSLRYPEDTVTVEEEDGYKVVGESHVSIIELMPETPIQEVLITQRLNMPVGWLADNTTLVISAYRSDGDEGKIYTYNLASSELKSLTPDNVCDLYPSVSPNGEQIVFTSMSDPKAQTGRFLLGLPDVFMMQADGTARRRLTNTPDVIEFAPAWSPDGQYIAYSAVNSDVASVSVFDMSRLESTAIVTFGGYEVDVFAPAWIPVSNEPVIARTVSDSEFKIRFSHYDIASSTFVDLAEFVWFTGELR